MFVKMKRRGPGRANDKGERTLTTGTGCGRYAKLRELLDSTLFILHTVLKVELIVLRMELLAWVKGKAYYFVE